MKHMLRKAFNPALFFLIISGTVSAESTAETSVSSVLFTVNNLWMLIATFLVFIMHLGFATLESGLTRAKNTVNILFKNIAVVAIGILTYTVIGFNLMYPGESWIISKVFGFSGFGISMPEGSAGLIQYANGAYTYWTDFLFQAMFAATAATIVSGAVAERIKLSSFLLFSVIYISLVYPLTGSWKWGGGWLDEMGFYDFAGSTLVHSVGGWAALAGILVLGPRTGKYIKGKVKPIPGHSLPLATIGVFLLWLGWFGFNGGSVLSADPGLVSLVFVTTTLGASAGILSAMITSWIIQKKPDLSMVLNGALAGLVAITASADCVSPLSAIIIGMAAGSIVVLAVIFIDNKLRIDDPVGALSVHLICGIFGTLAVGFFHSEKGLFIGGGADQLIIQVKGILSYAIFCFPAALLIFFIIKKTIGIRVSELEEKRGLDIGEHGMESYGGFQIFSNQ